MEHLLQCSFAEIHSTPEACGIKIACRLCRHQRLHASEVQQPSAHLLPAANLDELCISSCSPALRGTTNHKISWQLLMLRNFGDVVHRRFPFTLTCIALPSMQSAALCASSWHRLTWSASHRSIHLLLSIQGSASHMLFSDLTGACFHRFCKFKLIIYCLCCGANKICPEIRTPMILSPAD